MHVAVTGYTCNIKEQCTLCVICTTCMYMYMYMKIQAYM